MSATETTTAKTAPKAKAAKPAAAKPSTNGDAKKLGKPMVRILAALKKAGRPLTRKEIAEAAPVDLAWLTEYLGSHDAAVRAKNDKTKFPSLLTRGYVRIGSPSDDESRVPAYEITAAGKKALESALKEAAR